VANIKRRIGQDKGTAARVDLVTDARTSSPVQRAGRDALQFAPNFTVYVLPPDAVCLYSEHRKFFLHGELYYALACAIGAGKGRGELVRKLKHDFPADKIQEALKRLIDRRFVLTSRAFAERAGAYWASLGLSPEAAEKSFQKYRVQIQSIDVEGAYQLSADLKELGVQVAKRSADLTITLVSDYLDGRLAEVNRQHL